MICRWRDSLHVSLMAVMDVRRCAAAGLELVFAAVDGRYYRSD